MKEFEDVIKRALCEAAGLVVEKTKDYIRVNHHVTGNLENSIKPAPPSFSDIKTDENGIFIEIYTDGDTLINGNSKTNYAPFVHDGTGLYGPKKEVIRPKKAKALKTPYGFRKSIKGQKADPFFEVAFEINKNEIKDLIGREIGKSLKLLRWTK